MRFSTVLQLAVAARLPVVAQAQVRRPAMAHVRDPEAREPAEPQRELPEPLDERVRLIGEWQLGEA